jgi:V/A-type H+/Na+-transporting ATPase subunit A
MSGSTARIASISGPVLHASIDGPFLLREAIRVGPHGLLGEVIRVERDRIMAQVYEDTTGLRPGVVVEGTGQLLGIRVGPGLLGHIFDGLLRPLAHDASTARARFHFTPAVKVGDAAAAGSVFGQVSVPGARLQSPKAMSATTTPC